MRKVGCNLWNDTTKQMVKNVPGYFHKWSDTDRRGLIELPDGSCAWLDTETFHFIDTPTLQDLYPSPTVALPINTLEQGSTLNPMDQVFKFTQPDRSDLSIPERVVYMPIRNIISLVVTDVNDPNSTFRMVVSSKTASYNLAREDAVRLIAIMEGLCIG